MMVITKGKYPMNTVAIILARQNSKGIALKNLQLVGGVSLVGRAIMSAVDSGIFSHVVVSSDGDKIIQEAQTYPNVITIKRPAHLADDNASSIDGVIHALDELGIDEGICCLLQPTSPLRTATHIQEAHQLFAHKQYQGSVVSACHAQTHPYKMLIIKDDGYQPVHNLSDLEMPRQQLPVAYVPNGAIYFNDIAALKQNRRFFNEPLALYPMSAQHSLDIDSVDDLRLANQYCSVNHEDA